MPGHSRLSNVLGQLAAQSAPGCATAKGARRAPRAALAPWRPFRVIRCVSVFHDRYSDRRTDLRRPGGRCYRLQEAMGLKRPSTRRRPNSCAFPRVISAASGAIPPIARSSPGVFDKRTTSANTARLAMTIAGYILRLRLAESLNPITPGLTRRGVGLPTRLTWAPAARWLLEEM